MLEPIYKANNILILSFFQIVTLCQKTLAKLQIAKLQFANLQSAKKQTPLCINGLVTVPQ